MKHYFPALAAFGGACSLVAGPAFALELGELNVESKLGQPLRASIAYALQPNEQLNEYCISLRSGAPGNGLPGVTRARISVRDDAIFLTGSIPLREPMLGLQISINCPYTARLQREYTMFLDPLLPVADARAADPVVDEGLVETAIDSGVAAAPSIATRTTRTASPARLPPIDASSRYRVQPGDSLSTIVARINDRPRGLWPAAHAIFAANPDAFINGDINLIKAGSWLEIPDLYQVLGAGAPAQATAVPAATPVAAPAEHYQGPPSPQTSADGQFNSGYTEITAGAIAASPEPRIDVAAPAAAVTQTPAGTIRPGDVLVGDNSPFVSPIESGTTETAASAPAIVIPDTAIPVPDRRDASRAAAPASARSPVTGSWSWLAWLGGAGLVLFLGLLLFGRRVREKFGSTPIGAVAASSPQRRRPEPERRAAVPADVDFAFDSVATDAPSMSLDADLELGTGLRQTSDIDVAQDFGFSARHDFAQDIDFEFPPIPAEDPDPPTTDIIPPHRMVEPSILESEIPPSDDDDEYADYDLSMIVDATRQPVADTHLTAKDLKAVAVGSADDDEDSADYTLSREVDYKILEQDYQEEFTTTQALNEEITKAAMELAHSMGRNAPLDETAEMPRERRASDRTAELPGRGSLEITAELTGNLMPGADAVNDDLVHDLDDTGVNEELTAELPHGEHDITAEMAVEGGRIDTRKSRVS